MMVCCCGNTNKGCVPICVTVRKSCWQCLSGCDGPVIYATGEYPVVPGVTVTLRGPSSSTLVGTGTTDSNGRVCFETVPTSGSYTVSVSSPDSQHSAVSTVVYITCDP